MQGCTLVELVALLLLGIQAYHAAWQLSQGDTAQINLTRFGLGELDANAFGYSVSGRRNQAVTGRDMDCEDVWRGLLNPAPRVAEADPNKEIGSSINHIEPKPTIFYDTRTGAVLLDLDRVY